MNLEDLTYEYLRSFEAELKAKARERNKKMAVIFFMLSFLLPCGFIFCVVHYNLTISAGYFPIGIVEVVFVGSGIMFHTNVRQWNDYYERNFGKENVVRERSKNITNLKQVIQEEDNMPKDESQYRKDAREVLSETRWTFGKILPYLIIVIILLVLLSWALKSSLIVDRNIEREVTQHSQQYTESKGRLLQKLHADYLQLDAEIAELQQGDGSQQIIIAKKSQQKANISRMKSEADLIPQSEVPTEVKSFLENHGNGR